MASSASSPTVHHRGTRASSLVSARSRGDHDLIGETGGDECLGPLNRLGGRIGVERHADDVRSPRTTALLCGLLIENPFYLTPDEYLATRKSREP
jgi:hypothetical protein